MDHLTEQNQRMACLLGRVTGGLMMLPQLIPSTNLPAHMALEKIINDLYASIDKIFYGQPEQSAGFAVTPDKLKSLLREECEHESDGDVRYWFDPPATRCIK